MRGHLLTDADFDRAGGLTKALVELRLDDETLTVVDLDDPSELVARRLRPSLVATRRRAVTQRIAETIFDAGAAGFQWWSVLEAEWTNVTLFHERALPHVAIATAPRKLSTEMAEVQQAAERLGIRL